MLYRFDLETVEEKRLSADLCRDSLRSDGRFDLSHEVTPRTRNQCDSAMEKAELLALEFDSIAWKEGERVTRCRNNSGPGQKDCRFSVIDEFGIEDVCAQLRERSPTSSEAIKYRKRRCAVVQLKLKANARVSVKTRVRCNLDCTCPNQAARGSTVNLPFTHGGKPTP